MTLEPFALWVSLALVAVALAYAGRVWRGRGFAPGVDLLFVSAWLGAITVLHAPAPFELTASHLVEGTGLPAVIREADDRIHAVESLPGDWVDALTGPFGGWSEDQLPAPPRQAERRLERSVVPAVEELVSALIRGASFAFCALAMGTAYFLRRTASLRKELAQLRVRIEALEAGASPESRSV